MNISRRKFIRQTAIGAVAIAAPLLSSCNSSEESAVEAPINKSIPNPPTNLQVEESLRYVLLAWNAPTLNIDGSTLTDLQSYQIWRRALPSEEFIMIREIDKSGTIFIDANTNGKEVQYQVVGKTRQGQVSVPSKVSSAARAQLNISGSELPIDGELGFYLSSGRRTVESSAALVSVERISQQDFLALELICTHAGCGGMNFENSIWTCRCHQSQFDRQGNVLSPPAQSPLITLVANLQSNGDLTLRVASS